MHDAAARFIFSVPLPERSVLRAAITENWLTPEAALVNRLLSKASLPPAQAAGVVARAADWVRRLRLLSAEQSALDAFMRQYDLSSEEGVLLMCLAEALLRIPDHQTAEKLIADKLSDADWERHLGKSDSLFVNASTWGLMLTGRIVRVAPETTRNVRGALNRLLGRSTEPVIRLAVRQAMKLMGHQFVMGRTIAEALENAGSGTHRRYRHSFDMLGEAALTADDAKRYLQSYHHAILAIGGGTDASRHDPAWMRPSISVKLSALHPRYEFAQAARVLRELPAAVLGLAQAAKRQNIGLTIDAEEADRLELSLDVFEIIYRDPSLIGWEGLGIAVQAFQRRALSVIEWLENLAAEVGRKMPVRLVKGAYWDTEIKRAQEQGLPSYPVFTRKANTDVAYLACARRLLASRDVFYPMLATHNAHTAAAVHAYAGNDDGYEFQRLHGMGEALYRVIGEDLPVPCRIYAPVGSHEDLLPYLVRRLLENGANTSFVNRIYDEQVAPEVLVADPLAEVEALAIKANPAIPAPIELYGARWRNSLGINLADETELGALAAELSQTEPLPVIRSLIDASGIVTDAPRSLHSPTDSRRIIASWTALPPEAAITVIDSAVAAKGSWSLTPVERRAGLLETVADQLELQRSRFIRLLMLEAGKTLPDAVSEVREACDFLRFYAAEARRLMMHPQALPGPTGEHNELQLFPRGVFVCISPWNFPIAIFTGQIAAALVAGNCVVAKPAEQTPLIATELIGLMHAAGVPPGALQCVLGEGDIGAALLADPRVAGVAFTGSAEVARSINRTLASRDGAIGILIAETGGQNAMIVDSSALPEQVVKDVIASAFNAAGQRCSAARILCLQNDIADKVIAMLKGAMLGLVVGDPALLSTDVGPVIDAAAREKLIAHAEWMALENRVIQLLELPKDCENGFYFAPMAVEIQSIDELKEEHFGPILHVLRYPASALESLVDALNETGFGLTMAVHSRIESTWRRIQARAHVGNLYINRNQIGAVVGVQPFGGEGLSGTGPKAGGPHYLARFCLERTLTVNTAAIGGNARLLSGGS